MNIPANVTQIGEGAFATCDKLAAITVEPGSHVYCDMDGVVYTQDRKTIVQCPAGKSGAYTIPEDVAVIQGGVFESCANLKEISIPSTITEIGDYAFWNCYRLEGLSPAPASVQLIGKMPFPAGDPCGFRKPELLFHRVRFV